MMTRQHFQLIADVLKERVSIPADAQSQAMRSRIAWDFAYALAKTNPNFKRERFLAACGVES